MSYSDSGSYIDLYWLHIWDQITPAEEVMRAFDDLVRGGEGPLRRHLGRTRLGVVTKSNTLAELRGFASAWLSLFAAL